MNEDDVLPRVRAFVVETYLYMRPGTTLSDDDALLGKGIIDSLGVMELVGFVEATFGVRVDPAEITEINFGSVRGVARFVAARQGTS